jgi:hypothetical protein
MKYTFSIPIELNYQIDQTLIIFDTIDDIHDTMSEYNVDLQFIIDEFEYKSEAENMYADDDYIGIGSEDILKHVVLDNFTEVLEAFEENIRVDTTEIIDPLKLFILAFINGVLFITDFNNKLNLNITSVNAKCIDKNTSSILLDIESPTELLVDDINNLTEYLDDYFINNWDNFIGNKDLSNLINCADYYVYVKYNDNLCVKQAI